MSKTCKYCHAQLPDDASFCPYCAKSQIEKEPEKPPVPKRKKVLIVCLIAALAAIAAWIVWYQTKPKIMDNGGAEVVYQNGKDTWHFVLRNSIGDDFHWQTPQDTFTRMCTAGTQGACPLQLNIYDETTGYSVAEDFLNIMESSDITAVPRNNANPVECSEPVVNEGFTTAALVSDVVFDTDCGTNDVTWTIRLKNRDTIILHEVIEIQVNPEVYYSYETTPMNSVEEVQDLLEIIKAETEDPNTVVNITLAPVTYEGDLNILERAVNLTGSSDDKGSTVLRGCVTLDNRNPLFVSMTDLTFEGPGTGIRALEGFVISNCVFKEKDTGIMAAEGSWPIIDNCSFEDCVTGLHFNSTTSSMRNAFFGGLSFTGNETGVFLEKVPGTDVLYFIDCTFENNGEDIKNLAGNKISYSLDMSE